MARYTCLFTVALPVDNLQQSLSEIMDSCNFDVIYDTTDYLMGREFPGQVSFTKLVTVEFLIDSTMKTESELTFKLVMKSDELAIKLDNHCRQMFDRLTKAIAESNLQLIETVAG